ncbi:Calpain-type cysteine protease dek1 [Sarracenia purpurea var. burkii]
MRSAQAQIDLASGRLWSQLLRFKQEGFLLGAGSPSGSDVHISSSGIVQGHAYSLLQRCFIQCMVNSEVTEKYGEMIDNV